MKSKLKIFNSRNSSAAGFTLIELLVAASITTIVVSLAGFGMVAIAQNNQKAKAETERRIELNRALDFIADEVRQAKPIFTNASANLSTVAPGFDSTGKTPVLTLQIPNVSQPVIYYIAPKPTGSPWLGPNIVYRWGPNFLANGTYSNPTTPVDWTYQPLIDLIVDTAPSTNPNCSTSWFPNPTVADRQGFYTCVDPNGRIAEINLRGKLTGAYGNVTKPFEVNTKAFARPTNSPFTLNSGSSSSGGNGGTVTITQSSIMYIEVLGGDVACSPTTSSIPTRTKVNVTPKGGTTTSTLLSSSTKALNLPAAAGTTLTVTGILEASAANNSCSVSGNYNSATNNGTQVLTLRNGDSPPLFSPYGTQKPIDAFLTKYLDPTTGKIKLAENQVIFLYELVATNSSLSYYDMQDLVVLATISPSSN